MAASTPPLINSFKISYARNYAMSNVYEAGTGTSRTSEFAGVGFEFDNHHPKNQLTELEPIYSNYDASGSFLGHADVPNGGSCPNEADNECFEQYFTLPDNLTLVGADEGEVIYLNTGNGLKVCGFIGGGFGTIDSICDPSSNPNYGRPIDFVLRSDNGLTATIRIDPQTGYAKRIN
jgi:hypothetical protein